MTRVNIHASPYGGSPLNFHINKDGDTLDVQLTYPPWGAADNKNDQVRYVLFDQEAVRASDGVRLHYDYERDGVVVEQPRPRLIRTGPSSYEDEITWIEVGFFKSWKFDGRTAGDWSAEDYARADAEFSEKT